MTDNNVRRPNSARLARFAAVIAVTLFCMSGPAKGTTDVADTQAISATDAQILIYASPVAEKLRAEGSDMALEQQTSEKLNQSDYYYFWAYNSERKPNGSVTVGYFAVNKHTAEVWDTDENMLLSGKLLLDIQKLLRRANHISEDTVKKYTASPLWR